MLDRDTHSANRWGTFALALTLGWLVFATAAFADGEQQTATDSKPENSSETAGKTAADNAAPADSAATSGTGAETTSTPPLADVRAYRDPVTGEITTLPRPEQLDRLDTTPAKAMSRSTEGIEKFPLRSGGVGVHLKGRFRNALIVHRHPDGTFSASCVDHPEHAEESLDGTAPVTEATELEEM